MKRFTLIIAAGLLSLGMTSVNAQDGEDARSMADLLRLIEQGQSRDSQEARTREAEFASARNRQQSLLNQARAERTRQENISAQFEQQFEDNQQQIITARQALDERLGALKELFGVLQTVAGDTQGVFNASLTNIQYPDRSEFLVELGSKMAGASSLASIEDIEKLWAMLQKEVAESGRVVRFTNTVTKADGQTEEMEVVRVGLFNIINENGYLKSQNGALAELARQPEGRYTGTTADLIGSAPGDEDVAFGLDVTRGTILGLLVESPTVKDRIEQGGIVGYCIIALGIVGLLIAIWRWFGLTGDSRRVAAQLKRETAS
ncbi:MAG: biopolymer transport protein ExbB, partial [Woeseiaceae bacterium]